MINLESINNQSDRVLIFSKMLAFAVRVTGSIFSSYILNFEGIVHHAFAQKLSTVNQKTNKIAQSFVL